MNDYCTCEYKLTCVGRCAEKRIKELEQAEAKLAEVMPVVEEVANAYIRAKKKESWASSYLNLSVFMWAFDAVKKMGESDDI